MKLHMSDIFSPVMLGTTPEAVQAALESVRQKRVQYDAEVANGTRQPNKVTIRDGVVIVSQPERR